MKYTINIAAQAKADLRDIKALYEDRLKSIIGKAVLFGETRAVRRFFIGIII